MHPWNDLQELHDLACKAMVSWSLHYEESYGTWYVEISSSAPSENFVGKSRGFEEAITDACSWLRRLA